MSHSAIFEFNFLLFTIICTHPTLGNAIIGAVGAGADADLADVAVISCVYTMSNFILFFIALPELHLKNGSETFRTFLVIYI